MTKILLSLILLFAGAQAMAQFRVEVSGAGLTQFPIAIAGFRGNEGMTQKMAAIVQADLERSGQFRGVDPAGAVLDENARPDLSTWRKQGADALLTGSVIRVGDDRYEVRFRLWDSVRMQDLGGQSHAAPAAELRRVAHRIADAVYEKLTGEKGVFARAWCSELWAGPAGAESDQFCLTNVKPPRGLVGVAAVEAFELAAN